MRSYIYILYKLAQVLGILSPDAAMVMLLGAPGMSAFLDGLPFTPNLIVSGAVTWYLKTMIQYHVWPELPPDHQRFLLALRGHVLLNANVPPNDHAD